MINLEQIESKTNTSRGEEYSHQEFLHASEGQRTLVGAGEVRIR
jgi:hypothetical protein